MPVKRKGRSDGEWRRIAWIRKLEEAPATEAFPLGIGDDAAIWTPSRGTSAVLTVDVQVEGVHFRKQWLTLREIGERAVTSSVSDLAAMAACPVALLVSIVADHRLEEGDFKDLYLGIHKGARAYGTRILGGNLSTGPLSIAVTAIGEGKEPRLVRRGGARPGDEIWVTGIPGLARLGRKCLERGPSSPLLQMSQTNRLDTSNRRAVQAGLRAFRRPRARTREAILLARTCRPSAMVDLSDGLATDLAHILEESRSVRGAPLGAEITATDLTGRGHLARLAALLGEPAETAALVGGEDYELCFTVPQGRGGNRVARLFRDELKLAAACVGRIAGRPGIRLVRPDGSWQDVEERGWEHFTG